MIPVRLESTRLPQKALALIRDVPMIVHTWKRCTFSSALSELYVVTDSERIRKLIESHGGNVIMTGRHHVSGSDRLAEASENLDADIIVNIQGDEALVNPEDIDVLVNNFLRSGSPVGMLATRFKREGSPSDIKLVLNERKKVMYASRADIPFSKNGASNGFLKAYHVVAFRAEFLKLYSTWCPTELELIEGQEYLRILEKGYEISITEVQSDAISVDTVEDLKLVDHLMSEDTLFSQYENQVVRDVHFKD